MQEMSWELWSMIQLITSSLSTKNHSMKKDARCAAVYTYDECLARATTPVPDAMYIDADSYRSANDCSTARKKTSPQKLMDILVLTL